jgi:hypothetical protein
LAEKVANSTQRHHHQVPGGFPVSACGVAAVKELQTHLGDADSMSERRRLMLAWRHV